MTMPILRRRMAPLLAGLMMAVPAFAQDTDRAPHGGASAEQGSMGMSPMMGGNMQEMRSMRMSGDADRDFATMMKRHHQHGIQMAEMQLRNGKDPELRAQAQKIIDAQKKEIAELDRWLKQKGSASSAGESGAAEKQRSGSGK